MMFRKYLLSLLITIAFAFSALNAKAQQTSFEKSVKEDIHENVYLCAGNHLDYQKQLATEKLTKTPKGYEVFYLSHYGRHGSRWLCSDKDYTRPLNKLRKAHAQGKLTEKGEQLLATLETFHQTTSNRAGDLSRIGELQHHGIGKRMTEHFPELFKTKNLNVDARSTTVNRCILSMVAECEELAAFNPTIRFHNDVSDSLQFYLNQSWSKRLSQVYHKGNEVCSRYQYQWTNPEHLMSMLYNDSAWVRDSVNTRSLMRELFYVANNMQSHYTSGVYLSLLTDFFTKEEIYDLWRSENIDWYVHYGPAPITDGMMPFTQENLLRNIIETTDTITQKQATLRFGHEVCVLPLACLLELGFCGVQTTDYEHLDQYWRNYRIFPMGCNIQLIFYRPKRGKAGDILVKALLNEREVSLPVRTDNYPYYSWKDLRSYYLNKLENYNKQ